MKATYLRILLFISVLVPFLSRAQIVCIKCYNQNDSISAGVHNLISNGSFENTTCNFGISVESFCPNSQFSPCNITDWVCTGGGYDTYANFYDSTTTFVPLGERTAYLGNLWGSTCSNSTYDISCLVSTGCSVTGIPAGYPKSGPTYGGSLGVSLEQTVTGLVVGNIYVLEFWAGGETYSSLFTSNGIFGLDIGFGYTYLYCSPTEPHVGIGTRYIVEFRATATTHTIKFTNWGHICTTCAELMLDDVKLYTLAELSPSVPPCTLPIAATASHTNGNCGSCNGSATCTVSNGSGNLSYFWSTGATTQTINSLCAGTYRVTATDALSQTVTASVVVTQSAALTLVSSSTPTTCGKNNGLVSVTPSGNAPYTYHWSMGDSTATVDSLPAGTYIVTVTDFSGCSSTASKVVNSSTMSPIIVGANRTIMCSGDSTEVCATSGFANYLWSNGKTDSCFQARQAGNYYVTVTDNNGCTASSNHLAVNVYPLPSISISVNGDTLTSYNGVTYQWYRNGNIINGAIDNMYEAKQGGSYTVAITDSNGCSAVSNPVIVSGIDNLSPAFSVNVYPNPLDNGFWNVDCATDMLGSLIEIFDADGRLVFESKIIDTNSQIELNAQRGIYMLRISSANNAIVRKLIRL